MTTNTPAATGPSGPGDTKALPRTQDPQSRAASQILAAATELFHERSPASVSLREIARKAGVNYGLIHHYYGTKEAILAEVFRRSSDRGADVVSAAGDVEAVLGLLGQDPKAYARMLAWAILDSDTSQVFTGPTPAVTRLRELIEEQWATDGAGHPAADHADQDQRPDQDHPTGFDPRVVAATAVLAVMGWGLFAPFLIPAAGLGDRSEDDIRAEVRALVTRMAAAAAPPGP
ncbi:MAG: helix-turn-helix transcriptional regulator [Streptomycetaceae bacterium]|nr:helix-turn-helix transcriptional regulator [Streptomycetaceae bacterium]